jgi:hypothetical protein
VGDIFKVGQLVRLRPGAWFSDAYGRDALGVILKPSEIHGFLSRCYVMWTPFVKEWADIEDLEMVSNTTNTLDRELEE